MRRKIGEDNIRQKTKAIADFLRRVTPTSSHEPVSRFLTSPQKNVVTSASVTTPPVILWTSSEPIPGNKDVHDDAEDDDSFVEEENVGSVSSPYLMFNVYKRPFLDTQDGIRKDGDIFMIGDSPITVDTDGDIAIKERVFNGSKGLWEQLTRKNVNTEFMTKNYLKT